VCIEALVLAPTREIALQLHDYFNLLTKSLLEEQPTPSALLIGGLDLREQRKELLVKRPRIIFATLGRLIEVAVEREWLSLRSLKVFVMDEADKVVHKLKAGTRSVKTGGKKK